MKNKTKLKFDRFYFYNRWADKSFMRPSNWTYFGVLVRWAGFDSMCYRICFFGLELSIWFEEKQS